MITFDPESADGQWLHQRLVEVVADKVVAASVAKEADPVRRFLLIGDEWSGRTRVLRLVTQSLQDHDGFNDVSVLILDPFTDLQVSPSGGPPGRTAKQVGDLLLFLSTIFAPVPHLDIMSKVLAVSGAGAVVAGDNSERRMLEARPRAPGTVNEFVNQVRGIIRMRPTVVICVLDVERVGSPADARELIIKLQLLEAVHDCRVITVLACSMETASEVQTSGVQRWTPIVIPEVTAEQAARWLGQPLDLAASVCDLAKGRAALIVAFSRVLATAQSLPSAEQAAAFLKSWARDYVIDTVLDSAREEGFDKQSEQRVLDCLDAAALLALQGDQCRPSVLDAAGLGAARRDLQRTGRNALPERWLIERILTTGCKEEQWRLPRLIATLLRENLFTRITQARADMASADASPDIKPPIIQRTEHYLNALFTSCWNNLALISPHAVFAASAVGRMDFVEYHRRACAQAALDRRVDDAHLLARQLRGHGLKRWDDAHLMQTAQDVFNTLSLTPQEYQPRKIRRDLLAVATAARKLRQDHRPDLDTPLKDLSSAAQHRMRSGVRPEATRLLADVLLVLESREQPLDAFVPSRELIDLARDLPDVRRLVLLCVVGATYNAANFDIALHCILHLTSDLAFGPGPCSIHGGAASRLEMTASLLTVACTGWSGDRQAARTASGKCVRAAMRAAMADPDPARGTGLAISIMRTPISYDRDCEEFSISVLVRIARRASSSDRARLSALAYLISHMRSRDDYVQLATAAVADLLLRAERAVPEDECYYWAFAADYLERGVSQQHADVYRYMAAALAVGHANSAAPAELANLDCDIGTPSTWPAAGAILTGDGFNIPIDASHRDYAFSLGRGTRASSAALVDEWLDRLIDLLPLPWFDNLDLLRLETEILVREALADAGRIVNCDPFDIAERFALLDALPDLLGSAPRIP